MNVFGTLSFCSKNILLVFDHIFTSHHAGNGLQMSSTKVTKDKPASCYDRPASDNDKSGGTQISLEV